MSDIAHSLPLTTYVQQEQLKKLMSTLWSTPPHFVRCIVPIEFKKSGQWLKVFVSFALMWKTVMNLGTLS